MTIRPTPSRRWWIASWPPRNTANAGAASGWTPPATPTPRATSSQNQDVPIYPYAWTYRDYVVRSFNEDKPYNRFVLEQLAADSLPDGKGDSSHSPPWVS